MKLRDQVCVVALAFVLGAGLVLGLGAAGTPESMKEPSTNPETASQIGRFQIISNPAVRADTFMLDTSTGRIWRPIQFTDLEGEPTVWKYQERIDSFADLMIWSAAFKTKNEGP